MVKCLNSLMIKFVSQKLKVAVIIGVILGTILFIGFGKNIFMNYAIGFIVGCMNFVLLSLGMNLIVSNKPKKVRIIQFLFFTLRYLLIAYILIELVRSYNANIFAVAGGLLTNNAALTLWAFEKHFVLRKER
jgi:hypothetical protein